MSWLCEGFRIFWDDRGDAVDTICQDCYREIPKNELDPESMAPDPFPHVYNTYHMEVDSPLHCDWCERPIHHSLTSDGADYVVEAMKRLIQNADGSPRKILVEDYRKRDSSHLHKDRSQWYDGSPGYAVVLDWNSDLMFYSLDDESYEVGIKFVAEILKLEGSFRYKFYWKQEAFADAVTRPIVRAMNGRYEQTMREIKEFQG